MPYVHLDNFFSDPDYPEDTDSSYTFKLSRPVNNVELMILKHARLPIMPTIITGWNDVVYFYAASDGSGNTLLSATLSAGYYTPDELVAEMNTKMTAAATSAVFNSTYDSNTAKMTLVASENVRLSTVALVLAASNQNAADVFGRLARTIGYDNVLATAAQSIAMPYVMDLKSVRYFSLVIELNGYKNPECVGRVYPFSFLIPNNSDELQGNVVFNETSDFLQKNYVNHVNVNRIHIKTFLEDALNLNTDFMNGFNFEYFLELIQSKKYAYVGRSGS